MTLDIRGKEVVSKIINDIESSENRDRKKYEWQSFEIYSGDQRKHVLSELQRLFPDSWNSMRVSNINVEKKVIDKLARVYKTPPVRFINDNPNDDVDRIYSGFNKSFQVYDTSYNRHKNSLAWVQNNPGMPSEFNLKILDPYLFDLIIDPDSNQVMAVILSYPDTEITHFNGQLDASKIKRPDGQNQLIAESPGDSGATVKTYSVWTAEHQVVVTARKKVIQNEKITVLDFVIDESNPGMINPIGMLPFKWITTNPELPEFPISSPLAAESVNINVLSSDVLTASALQGFGLLLLKYPEGSQVNPKHTGFTVAMELPQKNDPDAKETTAEYINANPDLNGMNQVTMNYAEAVISDFGLQNFSLAGSSKNFTSGFDRALSMADVTEVRETNIQTFQEAEQSIFEIIQAYDKTNKTTMFSDKDELQVVYSKPRILQSEEDVLKNIKLKKELGLIENFEALMILDPNMSEKAAKEKLDRINESKKDILTTFSKVTDENNKESEREED